CAGDRTRRPGVHALRHRAPPSAHVQGVRGARGVAVRPGAAVIPPSAQSRGAREGDRDARRPRRPRPAAATRAAPAERASLVRLLNVPRPVLLGGEALQTTLRRMGEEIALDHPDGVVLIGVLKGALLFLADLARAIPDIPVEIDFIAISRFAPDSGRVRITQ